MRKYLFVVSLLALAACHDSPTAPEPKETRCFLVTTTGKRMFFPCDSTRGTGR